MKLIYDKPQSQGVENALKRAKQMVRFRWTPVRRFPQIMRIRTPGEEPSQHHTNFILKDLPQYGLPYSSVRIHEKYIGFNVSFETFVTALHDPRSILYTAPQHFLGKGMAPFYGTVCSAFVSYVCDLPYRVQCQTWTKLPGITPIPSDDLDKLQLCDILLSDRGLDHVMIVTGIGRDAAGHVQRVEVSEETNPQCRCLDYTPDELRRCYLDNQRWHFSVYRYAGIHDVTYTPSPFVYVEGDPDLPEPRFNPSLQAHYGEKANYERSEQVILNVFEDGWDEIAVTLPDGTEKTLPIKDMAAAFTPTQAGYYSAVCRAGSRVSEPTHWAVTGMKLSGEKTVFAPNEPLRLTVDDPAGNAAFAFIINNYQYNGKKQGFLPAPTAHGAVELPGLPVGEYMAFVVAKNDYGCYRSTRFHFTVEE